jgi:hypothetical protein
MAEETQGQSISRQYRQRAGLDPVTVEEGETLAAEESPVEEGENLAAEESPVEPEAE